MELVGAAVLEKPAVASEPEAPKTVAPEAEVPKTETPEAESGDQESTAK